MGAIPHRLIIFVCEVEKKYLILVDFYGELVYRNGLIGGNKGIPGFSPLKPTVRFGVKETNKKHFLFTF